MKHKKRALFQSVISLILCLSMLVGTTFAWFTDSVSSTGNIIQSGNLKIGMKWSADLENPDWQDASKDAIFDYPNWEPGYTDLKYLQISNKGNLAFQYQLTITEGTSSGQGATDSSEVLAAGETISDAVESGKETSPVSDVMKLAEVIDVYYANVTNKIVTRDQTKDMLTKVGTLADMLNGRLATAEGVLLATGSESSFIPSANVNVGSTTAAIMLKMREDAGNTYMGLDSQSGFRVQIVATQFAYEKDSLGKDYDTQAVKDKLQTFSNSIGFDGSISGTVSVETDDSGLTTAEVSIGNEAGGAVVPAGVQTEAGTTELSLAISQKESTDSGITKGENENLIPLDIHITGVSPKNTIPICVNLGKILPEGMNIGNVTLYHVESNGTNAMIQVFSLDELDEHNEFYYDPFTGNVTVSMATFSEVALVNDTTNVWQGEIDCSWYDASKTELTIANADQLAGLNKIVSGAANGIEQDSFAGKKVKLITDIDFKDSTWYPIGYWKEGDAVASVAFDDAPEAAYIIEEDTKSPASAAAVADAVWYTYGGAFQGTFDGAGHTISNIYQNTWSMDGDYDHGYWNEAMGLFGYVYGGTVKNLTVHNFQSDGEFTPTGVIAAYAANATFENIAITNCIPRVYNTGNGGIVGIGGNSSDPDTYRLTFNNITIDNSNIITSLWGSWDTACGGLVGMFRGAGHVDMTNCHVAAQIDVFNDVCGNYQYYWYRYSGMMIGTNKNMVTDEAGYTVPETSKFHAEGCTVHFGEWNDYYYCELVANSLASYTHDHQFSRLEQIQNVSEIQDENGNWKETGNFVLMNGKTPTETCYHIVSKDGVLSQHNHEDAGMETVNGETVLKEDKQIVYLPFNQLFTGYGWGVKHIPVYNGEDYAFEGITILDRNVANSVVKFEGKVTELPNNAEIKLGDIFNFVDNGVELKPDALTVTVTNLAENNPVTAEIKYDEQNWENGTLTLSGIGEVQITIQDYYFCTPTTITVNVTDRQPAEKFDIVMNKGDFLHRVGNSGTVALDKLFKAKDGVTVGTVSVTVEAVNGSSASGAYSNNAIQFTGTGNVKVTITDNDYCIPAELTLQVIDAVNATGATNATSNNVVLLNDCGFSSLEVSGGYTLYGNGFTMTCGSDSAALDMGYSFVTLNNGTLDNVQIVCPNFDYAVLYKSNMTESGNRSETTDKTRYYNVKSGVMASGNSQILNSRISGARAAVNVTGGNVLIDNSRIELGAVASILVGSANSLTLRDVTLMQKPTASTYDSSKTLMGFSVLFVCDADGNTAPVILEGTLVQQAWVNEEYKNYVPSAGQSIISTVLGKTEYLHDIDGDGKNESLNLGFAYMPESVSSKVNATTITDNRTNKNDVPYDYAEVSILNGKTYVYSYKNTNGTEDGFKTESDYVSNKYGDIITVTYSDTADGLESSKSHGTNGWVYELNVDLDKLSGYTLDFSKLEMSVNGELVTDYKVNGAAKPTSPVAVTAGGVTYTLTATVEGKDHVAIFKVIGTETSKESPSKISGPTTAGFGVAKSYGGDWSGAADVLTGVKIKYWSVAENKYVDFDFSNFTVPGNAGKLNGTNSYWEYTHTNNDFTLKVTNTVAIHSGKSVYGMPIRGTDGKLYFTISSTNGYVGSGTTSRAITMQYEFTDNNGGEKLTFTHTFNISYNKDDQYSYSDLSGGGNLTKLAGSSGGGSSSCVTPDTLITLANGKQVRVDSLTGNEQLLVWNMETGKLDSAPIMFVDSDPEAEFEIIHLYFSDGTDVKVISEHGFWDYDLNRYVYLDRYADKYIGHTFAKQSGSKLSKVKLTDVVLETEVTTAWSPVTAGHLCYFVNGMLSMPGGVGGLFNIFDVDPATMTYDYEAMAKDIEAYGLFTYEEMNAMVPLSEDMFNAAGGAYLKISIGKGNMTLDDLVNMIQRYSKYI